MGLFVGVLGPYAEILRVLMVNTNAFIAKTSNGILPDDILIFFGPRFI